MLMLSICGLSHKNLFHNDTYLNWNLFTLIDKKDTFRVACAIQDGDIYKRWHTLKN